MASAEQIAAARRALRPAEDDALAAEDAALSDEEVARALQAVAREPSPGGSKLASNAPVTDLGDIDGPPARDLGEIDRRMVGPVRTSLTAADYGPDLSSAGGMYAISEEQARARGWTPPTSSAPSPRSLLGAAGPPPSPAEQPPGPPEAPGGPDEGMAPPMPRPQIIPGHYDYSRTGLTPEMRAGLLGDVRDVGEASQQIARNQGYAQMGLAGALEHEAMRADEARAQRIAEEARRRAYMAQQRDKLEAQTDELQKTSVDGSRFWKSPGAIMMAIGAALRSGNEGFEVLDRAIQRDIDSQKAQITTKHSALQARQNLVAVAREQFADEQQADTAAEIWARENAATRVRSMAARSGSQELMDRAGVIAAEQQQKANELRAQFMRMAWVPPQMIGGAGIGGKEAKENAELYVPRAGGDALTKDQAAEARARGEATARILRRVREIQEIRARGLLSPADKAAVDTAKNDILINYPETKGIKRQPNQADMDRLAEMLGESETRMPGWTGGTQADAHLRAFGRGLAADEQEMYRSFGVGRARQGYTVDPRTGRTIRANELTGEDYKRGVNAPVPPKPTKEISDARLKTALAPMGGMGTSGADQVRDMVSKEQAAGAKEEGSPQEGGFGGFGSFMSDRAAKQDARAEGYAAGHRAGATQATADHTGMTPAEIRMQQERAGMLRMIGAGALGAQPAPSMQRAPVAPVAPRRDIWGGIPGGSPPTPGAPYRGPGLVEGYRAMQPMQALSDKEAKERARAEGMREGARIVASDQTPMSAWIDPRQAPHATRFAGAAPAPASVTAAPRGAPPRTLWRSEAPPMVQAEPEIRSVPLLEGRPIVAAPAEVQSYPAMPPGYVPPMHGQTNVPGPILHDEQLQGAPMQLSDERLKDDPRHAEPARMLDRLQPYSYNYKPGVGEDPSRRRYGIMAQDLERSPMGASVVDETSRGKEIDVPHATGALFAAAANLNERQRMIERAIAALKKRGA